MENLSVSGYSQFTSPTSLVIPEAVGAIQRLKLPYEISSKAVEIFYRLETTGNKKVKSLRSRRKNRRIFLSVFLAYNELGCPRDPIAVANAIQMDTSEIEQALSESPINIVIDPIELSQFYTQQINQISPEIAFNVPEVKSEIQRIIETCKQSQVGRETCNNSPAKHIAVGALCFYILEILGLPIPRDIFEKACFLSWACLTKYHREVVALYNTQGD